MTAEQGGSAAPSGEASSGGPAEPPANKRTANRRIQRKDTIKFVVLFVVYILAALGGYRYAVDTEANMWYLFKVAQHTAAVLDVVGHESEVEPGIMRDPNGAIRQQLAEWRTGKEAANTAAAAAHDSEAESPPERTNLTPWEKWLHKAYQILEQGGTIQEEGPMVTFVFRQGLVPRLNELRKRQAELLQDESLATEERNERLEPLVEERQRLEEQNKAIPSGPEGLRARQGYVFAFRLVPDCGAIPLMSIYVAAVLAFPARLWKRAAGIFTGVPILYAVNLGRLSTLAIIGAVDPSRDHQWFNFAHEFVWQGIFIIFVVAVWMGWMELVVNPRRKRAA